MGHDDVLRLVSESEYLYRIMTKFESFVWTWPVHRGLRTLGGVPNVHTRDGCARKERKQNHSAASDSFTVMNCLQFWYHIHNVTKRKWGRVTVIDTLQYKCVRIKLTKPADAWIHVGSSVRLFTHLDRWPSVIQRRKKTKVSRLVYQFPCVTWYTLRGDNW